MISASIDRCKLLAYVSQSLHKAYVIPVAKVCNARCVFCATDVYDPRADNEMMPPVGLGEVAELLTSMGVARFEVTGGGEPTLHPNLVTLIAQLRLANSAAQIKLYTNGARWKSIPLVDEVNISRVAWDPDQNQRVMKIRGGSPDLTVLIPRLRALGVQRIRLSTPIIRGGVTSATRAENMLEMTRGLVDSVVFRPLYPATPGREMLETEWDSRSMQSEVSELGRKFPDLTVELDAEGCFRSSQLILASDLALYRNWSLSEFAPGWSV